MNERTITFRLGEENGIVIQKDSFDTSLFLNQYQLAIEIFDYLWEEQQKWENSSNNSLYLDNQFSNVIAFCGDRGEGKTSCMSSFATILTDEIVRAEAKKVVKFPERFISCDKIEWLGTIDPSFFDRKHNLLELLLGRMYAKVVDEMRNNYSNNECNKQYNRRLLMEQFERVKSDISNIEQNDKIYDSLEEISDLAAGVNLKKDLRELFDRYLTYVNKKCLVICIDDLDLNISEGYKMAEMLRKYLICPQCMILVAVKVGQLIEVIATAHSKEIKDAAISWERCLNMAQRYVAKLLPRGNRVTMPIPADFCEYTLNIADKNNQVNAAESGLTVKEKIVQMIFQKTGYVFYNTQRLSPIIPKNLRGIRHLLGMLYSLPNAKDGEWNDNEIGREVFKNYFFGTWAAQLPDKDYTFAQQLAQYDDLTTLNAFVVEYFAKRVKNDAKIEIAETDIDEEYAKLYLSITSKKNTATNISYGDVMYILWFINRISLNMTIQNLIFLIKTIYSIRLYACYNIVSQGEKYLYPPTPDVENIVHIHRAETLYKHVNQLQKLINGSYFTYPQGTLLPMIANDGVAFRDRVILPIDRIKLLANNINDLDELRLCEYMALCISRTTIHKEQISNQALNRMEKIPTYLGTLSPTANYVVFDFLQPFYSLCNVEYAYRRIDGILNLKKENTPISLFEIAQQTQGSLYNEFLNLYEQSGIWGKQHSLISDAIIRISEVQWAIYDELLRTRNLHKNGDEAVFSAYTDIQKLEIKLYPLIRENKKGMIPSGILTFNFLSVFSLVNKQRFKEITYISKEDVSNDERNAFMRDFLFATQDYYLWPMKGREVKHLLIDISKLEGKRKNSFTQRVGKLFINTEQYERKQVQEKLKDVLAIYLIAKKLNS